MRDPSLLTLEEFKTFAGIPLEDTRQDALLRSLIQEVSKELEQRTGRLFLTKELEQYITPSEHKRTVDTPITMIALAIVELLEHLRWCNSPMGESEENNALQAFFKQAATSWQENPERRLVLTREFTKLETKDLLCIPVQRVLTFDPQLQIVQGVATLIEPLTAECVGEFALVFLKTGTSAPARRVEVIVEWGGSQERPQFHKQVRKGLAHYARKRLYFPPLQELRTEQQVRLMREDALALVALYLVQEKLISLDDDQGVRDFLLSYLGRRFKGTKQVGEAAILAEILGHYQIPEDYRAWRKYVRRTIQGLAAKEKQQERTYVIADPSGTEKHFMIPAVADRLGMPRRSLYHRVKQGAVRTEEVTVGGRQYQTIPHAEIDRLEQEQHQQQLRKALIAAWAKKQKISPTSARRWVERQEEKGRGLQEMGEMIGRQWLKNAIRVQSQDAKT